MKSKILISACLLGAPVRYDGVGKAVSHPLLTRLLAEGRLVPFCPEVAGGLPIPRAAGRSSSRSRLRPELEAMPAALWQWAQLASR